MACPFFLPIARLATDEWVHAPRLPLGDPFRGECHVSPEPFEPSEADQRELCNCGYARGRCARFPEDAPDAIRFSMTMEGKIVWIFERDHAPAEFGFAGELKNDIVAAQLRAFVESYRRKSAVLPLSDGAGA